MKNVLTIALAALMSLPLFSQTDFRHISYDEALLAAKAEKKMVFIDFYTDWCGPCKMMARDVFPQKVVGDFLNEKFVCIKLNAEKEGKEIAGRYKIDAYPTFIAIDDNEKVLMTKVGADSNVENFIKSIARQVDPDKSSIRLKERYDSGERTADLISAYGDMKMEEAYVTSDKSKEQEANKIVHDYFDSLTDIQKLAPENFFMYSTTYAYSPFDKIAEYMIAHRNKFNPSMKEKVEGLIDMLYKVQIQDYMMGDLTYNEAEFKKVKDSIISLGLNKNNQYTEALKFIECHIKNNPSVFLTMCETNFKKLNNEQQGYMLRGFAKLIKTEDKAVRKRAAKFVRSQIVDMEASVIYFAARQIYDLEGGEH